MGGLSLDQDDQMRTRTEVAVKNWNEKYSSQSRVVIAGSIREVGDSGRIPPQLVRHLSTWSQSWELLSPPLVPTLRSGTAVASLGPTRTAGSPTPVPGQHQSGNS